MDEIEARALTTLGRLGGIMEELTEALRHASEGSDSRRTRAIMADMHIKAMTGRDAYRTFQDWVENRPAAPAPPTHH